MLLFLSKLVFQVYISCLLVAIGPTCVVNHCWGNNGIACGQKNGGLYKYPSRINVSYLSALFWSVYFRATNLMQIPVPVHKNINIIFALLMDSELGRHKWTLNGKFISVLRTVPMSALSSSYRCLPDDLTLTSWWDTWHPHIAAVAKGMMTSCLLPSERLKEDIDD